MFDVPMNTREAVDLSAPGFGMGGQSNLNAGASTNNMGAGNMGAGMGAGMGNMGMPQQNMGAQQNYQQPTYQQPTYQQPVQQPVQQPTYNQPAQQAPMGGAVQHYEKPSSGGVILKKGAKSNLGALVPNGTLTNIKVCLGWDTKGYQNYDLDSSCFMLGADKRVVGDDWFVFYNQPTSPDGAIMHNGDNKTGAGDGDDEIISVALNRLDNRVERLVFTITINEAIENRYNFSCVSNAFARIVDMNTNKELAIFNLTDYYDTVTAMIVFELYKHKGEWKINPVGNGLKDTDLLKLCEFYGVNVAG